MNRALPGRLSRARRPSTLALAVALAAGLGLTSAAASSPAEDGPGVELASAVSSKPGRTILLTAARVFDGDQLGTDLAVLIEDGKTKAVGSAESLHRRAQTRIDLGDATILPGFIELHGHLTLQSVPHDTVLKQGVTTVREVGGPLLAGGNGELRVLGAGPIITSPGGYPIPVFPEGTVAVTTQAQARQLVIAFSRWLFSAGCRATCLRYHDHGRPTGAGVRLVAGRAVAFLIDAHPAATGLMLAREQGPFSIARHPDLLSARLICVDRHGTPVDTSRQISR